METTLSNRREKLFEELDYRENDGIEVSLLRDPGNNNLTVYVCDTRTNDTFELPVKPQDARELLLHPFAYSQS